MTQQQALDILRSGASVFLTGEPGSGKTHTVNAYVAWLRSHGIEPAITASTGIAATHIQGMTIHSWSGIGVLERMTPEALDAIVSKEHVVRRIQKASVLIIDEVSMLSANVLSMVDEVARAVRRNGSAFGGMQVVLVGDFFQLPPVSRGTVKVPFAFESGSWASLNPLVCYLTEQHRQDDPRFLSILSAIRAGESDHTHVSSIMTRETDLDGVDEDTPRLYTHNMDVDRINADKLALLPAKSYRYTMDTTGPAVLTEALKRGCLSPDMLELKEGAVVMCTKNNATAGYVNGTLGTVIGVERGTNYPIIETRDGRELTIAPAEWAVEENGKVRAKLAQVPLRLAWAITVHKSQGMSMDAAAMDLSRAFEYGQGYVALSRVRRLDGLYLLGWSEQALAMHPLVASKDADLREQSEAAEVAFAALADSGELMTLEKNFIKACGGTLEAAAPGAVKAAKKTTYEETLALIEEGKSVDEVVAVRKLTFGTICDHIEKLVESGRLKAAAVEPLIPEVISAALPAISKAFDAVGTEKLSPAFGKLKGKYSYDQLRLARVVYLASA